MKIGLVTDSLGHLSFEKLLPAARAVGIEALEFCCGNWSKAPHIDLDRMLASDRARREFLARVEDHDLSISALNCSGNHLAPGDYGRRHDAVVTKTFRLAKLMGIDRIVMMSGCPGGPGDANPNWITTAWPPEATKVLEWQWSKVVIPYWRKLAALARKSGVKRIAIEIHGGMVVYNTASLLKLRDAVGEVVGANLDPSHMLWMGGDPIKAVKPLGDAIHYVHAKDTRIDPWNAGLNTTLETRPGERFAERAWNYVTLGYGHDDAWWRSFLFELKAAGYDDVLSIEHEDQIMAPLEGVKKSAELLDRVMPREPTADRPRPKPSRAGSSSTTRPRR